ncbi:MAG: hypothetical protein V1827_03170 [Candidatus Micrarchaeota archaeon]
MPKKGPTPGYGAGAARRIPLKTDVSSVEEETIRRVNHTLETIEDFLSRWETSKIKPDQMLPQISRIRRFHKELSAWQREAQRQKGRGGEDERVKRLEEFVLICTSYS